MKVMYKVSHYHVEIKPMIIAKETPHFVQIAGSRFKEAKQNTWGGFYNTREEAKDYLVTRCNKRVSNLTRSLADAVHDLKMAEAL